MSRRICRASSNCSALSMRLRIMKLTARRVSITLRRMRPFRSSCWAIAASASPAAWSLTSLLQHARADRLQVVVDAFERVGAVLGVGVVELQQHVLGVLDQRRDAPRAQAQQAEHRHVLVVDREQHAVRCRMKATRTLRGVFVVDQEVGADVQLAVVFFVEARRLLEVVVDRRPPGSSGRSARRSSPFPPASALRGRPTPGARARAPRRLRFLPGTAGRWPA